MVFHGSDFLLMQLDMMRVKFKSKQVRKTAEEYFTVAANIMDITKEELAYRIARI